MRAWFAVLAVLLFTACSSDDIDDAIDLAEGVPRKTIDVSRLGVNAFANDLRFGSIGAQYREVSNELGIRHVRILFAWNDAVQPTPGAAPNFSFYDDIAAALPANVDAVVVLTGIPSWMQNPANWIEGNPRTTFSERWVRTVARRYRNNSRIAAYQIWNEPNMLANPDNSVMGFADNPEAYVELLARASSIVRDVAPGRLVVNAATTAINQNFPDTLNYNKRMRDAGALSFVDVYAFHYYGRQFERFLFDGSRDFLNGLPVRLWATESGEQGVNKQLGYGEQVWPFLLEQISGLERIYIYQFTEATPPDVSYGLRTLDPAAPVSDLYIHLRDRNRS